jgi:hypothetical protein
VLIEVVTSEHLRHRTIDVLVAVIRHVLAVDLKRVEIGELLGDTAEQSLAASALRFRRGIHGAQITGHHGLRPHGSDNQRHGKLHILPSFAKRQPRIQYKTPGARDRRANDRA